MGKQFGKESRLKAASKIESARQQTKKSEAGASLFKIWSGKGGSNSRPQPWQGCALPTELFPQIPAFCYFK
jgi:hypothetical protein